MSAATPDQPNTKRASHVEILEKSVHRSYGIATALMFMTEIDLGDDPVRFDTFRNAVEELAGALKDILSVALEFDLAGERKAEARCWQHHTGSTEGNT